jgi:hypothetical protein
MRMDASDYMNKSNEQINRQGSQIPDIRISRDEKMNGVTSTAHINNMLGMYDMNSPPNPVDRSTIDDGAMQ